MRERDKMRAARRGVAMEVADFMAHHLANGFVGSGLMGEDRERFEAAWSDVKDEMMRRAGVDPKPRATDERQHTLNEWLAEEGHTLIEDPA